MPADKPLRVTRTVSIPDRVRLSRYLKAPELGPRILFFSGGTALTATSRVLKRYTHNSIHLVTPFDSGGSSAELRKAFAMPSIGDLRSRLMALADESVLGHPEIYELFNLRFSKTATNAELRTRLQALALGNTPETADIINPMGHLIRNQLGYFFNAMPEDFDLRGASIGNLILAGGYVNTNQALNPIIFQFSKLVNTQGTVRAIVEEDLQLGARLEDGSHVIGQHLLTGKEVAPLASPIETLFLSQERNEYVPAQPKIRKTNRKLIQSADLICYPPGSFYSSLLANLLPGRVGQSIASNDCPKVYVPNLGSDPEQIGMDLAAMVSRLIKQLQADVAETCEVGQLLNFVLVDSKHANYNSDLPRGLLKELGIELIDMDLISPESAPYYDNEMLVSALLSLT